MTHKKVSKGVGVLMFYSYSKTNQMHQCIKIIYFRMTLYMFRAVFPYIIRSSRPYIQQYLFVKCLLLYVQSWTPDDVRKDRPKHVECHSKINNFDTLVHLVGFTIGILLRCTALWTSNSSVLILIIFYYNIMLFLIYFVYSLPSYILEKPLCYCIGKT